MQELTRASAALSPTMCFAACKQRWANDSYAYRIRNPGNQIIRFQEVICDSNSTSSQHNALPVLIPKLQFCRKLLQIKHLTSSQVPQRVNDLSLRHVLTTGDVHVAAVLFHNALNTTFAFSSASLQDSSGQATELPAIQPLECSASDMSGKLQCMFNVLTRLDRFEATLIQRNKSCIGCIAMISYVHRSLYWSLAKQLSTYIPHTSLRQRPTAAIKSSLLGAFDK